MGYAYDEIDGRTRGYAVSCTCHKRGCGERIDRGLSYLCSCCTWYYCGTHRTRADDQDDHDSEVQSFAGLGAQVCERGADHLEQDALDAMSAAERKVGRRPCTVYEF